MQQQTPSTAGKTATAEMSAIAGMKSTAERLTTPGTPTKAGNPAKIRTSGSKGMPAAAKLLATSGTHPLAGGQAPAMMQATTMTPRPADMSETVLMPTTREFSQKDAISLKIQRKRFKIALFCPIGSN